MVIHCIIGTNHCDGLITNRFFHILAKGVTVWKIRHACVIKKVRAVYPVPVIE